MHEMKLKKQLYFYVNFYRILALNFLTIQKSYKLQNKKSHSIRVVFFMCIKYEGLRTLSPRINIFKKADLTRQPIFYFLWVSS